MISDSNIFGFGKFEILKCLSVSASYFSLSGFLRMLKFYKMELIFRFDNHNDAAQAITSKHGSTLEGYTIKCSWGKEGAIAPGGQNMSSGYNNGVRLFFRY